MTPTLSDLQRENAELRRMLDLTGKQLKAALEVVATMHAAGNPGITPTDLTKQPNCD